MPSADQAAMGARQGQLEGVPEQAMKILSLRLPRVLGARSLSPSSLMTSPGSAGVPGGQGLNPLAIVFRSILNSMTTGGTPPTGPINTGGGYSGIGARPGGGPTGPLGPLGGNPGGGGSNTLGGGGSSGNFTPSSVNPGGLMGPTGPGIVPPKKKIGPPKVTPGNTGGNLTQNTINYTGTGGPPAHLGTGAPNRFKPY